MITYWQAIILGLLQGISELFPISSLGHTVIVPSLLGWHLDQKNPAFLTFLVTTHAATAIVLFLFFWKDWKRIIGGFFRSLKEREIKESDPDAKLAWLLIVGTIPAGVLGLLFEESFKTFFASARFAAFFLFLNGIMLFAAEFLRKKQIKKSVQQDSDTRIAKTNWFQAFGVGAAQAIALFPGFSRTGSTIAGGLLVGLSHEDAVKYSFFLATPIIGAAALLKIPELFSTSEQSILGQALIGSLFAGVSAYFAIKFLIKYFQTNKLTPFAIYCVCAGGLLSLLFFFFPL
jgi:undecaprenyl-diphosphatase